MTLSDSIVDLIDSDVDLAFRYGSLNDSSYISRSLASNYRVLCASPDYLQLYGTPLTPVDLLYHQCLNIGIQIMTDWKLNDEIIRIRAYFSANDGYVIHQRALQG